MLKIGINANARLSPSDQLSHFRKRQITSEIRHQRLIRETAYLDHLMFLDKQVCEFFGVWIIFWGYRSR
jgi:hypothetical protein